MQFYVLKNPEDNKLALTDFIPLEPHNIGEAPLCTTCGKALGMLPWLPPYRVEIEFWGKEAGDIAFGPGNELLISEKFKLSYERHKLGGLSNFAPVLVVKVKNRSKKSPKEVPNYFCVTIARSRAIIDHKLSGLLLDEPWTCKECRLGGIIKKISKVVIEKNTWSGEDIFFARGLPGIIITTERFKKFFIDAGINNGELVESTQYKFDNYPWESK
jgi:hypothetical protein